MFVVRRPNSSFELRTSNWSGGRARSRTLATFRILTDDVLDHAARRFDGDLDRAAAIDAAHRVGAPVAAPRVDWLIGELLKALHDPRQPRPRAGLVELLVRTLAGDPVEAHLQGVIPWLNSTPEQRGEALRQLLGEEDP